MGDILFERGGFPVVTIDLAVGYARRARAHIGVCILEGCLV